MANIREAITLYLETLNPEEKADLSEKQILTTTLEVTVP